MTATAPDYVVRMAMDLGLADTFEEADFEIRRMVAYSAPLTHKKGNRRYRKWVFQVKDGVVHRIERM